MWNELARLLTIIRFILFWHLRICETFRSGTSHYQADGTWPWPWPWPRPVDGMDAAGSDRWPAVDCDWEMVETVAHPRQLLLVVPSTRRASIGDRAFAVAGPRAWNSLPPALRSQPPPSFTTFKKELKSFLFGLSLCLWQRIPFIDYVQRSSSCLYRRLRYRNCLNYITLHYVTLRLPSAFASPDDVYTAVSQSGSNCQ